MNRKILFINACVRPESRTLRLARRVLDSLEGDLEEICLNEEPVSALDNASLEQRTADVKAGFFDRPSMAYARQFSQADTVVIAAPFWDLSFPALLKSYIESINVAGVTFFYGDDGLPHSLCRAEQLIYVTTCGGPYVPGFGFDYVKALATLFYGITDIRLFKAENLDIYGADTESILAAAEAEIDRAMPLMHISQSNL